MKYDARKELHPITEDGLDQFFLQCTQLEELSLFCLHQDIRLPPSFFQLTRLRTVALTDASALESPSLGNFRCLTSLYIASQKISQQQLSGLVRLPSLNNLSIYNYTRLIRNEQRAAAIAIAQIPRLKSLEFRVMFPSGTPCTNLERLRITSSRHLDRLPDRIGDLLPNLRELNFRFCELFFHLPQDFTSLNSLESLVISMCNSFSRLPEDFGRLPALKTLVLDELPRLCHLPASLSELSSLETLFLIGSPEIRQLPAGFCSLTGLKTLCLMKMPGIVLPEGIGGLSSLQTFLLNDNDHHQLLPASFTQLSSLTRLELSKITMDNLPADIGNLIRLRQLHVHCCTVNELPESLTSLSKLEVLTFVECRELMVPSGLENLRKLKRLELPCEPPQPLPPSLEVLTLGSKKNFTSLPDIAMPASLQKLSFTFVEMQSGGMVLSRSLANLQHLELVLDESVKAIPFPLISLPHLRTLEILSAGILEELPSNIGSAMPQLRQLLIHEADSLTELPASVTQLQHLTSLEVWAPKLASVPHDIGALSQLRRLDLSNCLALEQLPSSLTQLSCLHELVLKNTSIRSLPPSFAHLTRLRTLNLNKCKQLAALPEDLTELRMLHRLDVGGCRQFLDRGGVRALAASSMYGLRIDRE
ncbi:hypothetical protein CLOM_g17789 [Closterium sp. NIES-68]|nr:hypothetical protein CLOM_g17789 [Closterium sp. NIES-68]GJP62273.1 hypothetical protein CLOP_g19358 [Closterium sp. NIES-67]